MRDSWRGREGGRDGWGVRERGIGGSDLVMREKAEGMSLLISVHVFSPQAKAGKTVDVEELPPVISTGHQEGKPRPQPQAVQGGGDEFELSEEDLAAWAGNLVDDRKGGWVVVYG